jgi:hypothetical protein
MTLYLNMMARGKKLSGSHCDRSDPEHHASENALEEDVHRGAFTTIHRRCPRFAFCVFAGRAARKHWDVWPASRRESSAESGLLGFQEAALPNQGHGRGFRRRQGGEYSHLTSCSSPPCCRDAQFVFCG